MFGSRLLRSVVARNASFTRLAPRAMSTACPSAAPTFSGRMAGLALGLGVLGGVGFASCSSNSDAYNIPLGDKAPREIRAFVEVTKGSRMKYEYDKDIGFLVLDRVLHSAVFYPWTYGFIPQTLCGDGDPLDVLIMGDPVEPGAVVMVRPIGYMVMEDEKGLDEKMLAVPVEDPRFADIETLRDVPEHTLREITHFFETYKALERSKWVKTGGWKGTEDTRDLIVSTHKSFIEAKEALTKAKKPAADATAAKDGAGDEKKAGAWFK